MRIATWLTLIGASVLAAAGCGGQGPGSGARIDIPGVIEGTTVDAKLSDGERACGTAGPTVWYRFHREDKGRIALAFHAAGDLEAVVCAMRDGAEGPEGVTAARTDDQGNAGFDFDADVDTTYYLAVVQDPESEPDEYTFDVKALARPGNDERDNAALITSLPSTRSGTTVGATRDEQDPPCVEGRPSVWYGLTSASANRVVLRLQAQRGIETRLCALQKVRSHLRVLDNDATDRGGRASVAFKTDAGATYFVAVARPTRTAGRFSLAAQRPDPPHAMPGTDLRGGAAQGYLHPLANASDAWAVTMKRGTTYRLALATKPDECVSMKVYTLRARNFRAGVVAAEFECAGTEFFAPGPDGGGTYPVLLTTGGAETTYRLYVNPVEPDDSGPGVPLESSQRVVGFVSPADPLDLYRFDVPGRSSVEIGFGSKRFVEGVVRDGYGHTITHLEPNSTDVLELDTGTYYLAVTPGEYRSRYSLRVTVRFVTTTWLAVNGASSVTIAPGAAVNVQTSTVPYPGPGVTEVQADFFDVATGKWVFRQLWKVAPGSSISFTPDAVGRWRVRATFEANDVASRSRTKYCSITVSTI